MNFSIKKHLLEDCFRRVHPNSNITIKEYEYGAYQVAPGTSYCSEIVSAIVTYTCDGRLMKKSFVIKIPFLSAHYEDLKKLGFYDKETYIYDAVIPKMEEISNISFAPKHYQTMESHIIALEDLCEQGYHLAEEKTLNFDQSRKIFHNLAMFHATSVKIDQLYPKLLEPVSRETIFVPCVVESMLKYTQPILLDALREEQVCPKIIDKFVSYNEKMLNSEICHISNRLHDFNVLNHGDLNTHNFLFKNDDAGRVSTVKFLDYQTCRWNSPIFDLIFFNMRTLDFNVFEKHYDELLDLYLTALNGTLEELECSCTYTQEEYETDNEKCKLFKIFVLIWIGYRDIREIDKNFNHDSATQFGITEVTKLRESEMFQKRFLNWFWYYQKRGYFD